MKEQKSDALVRKVVDETTGEERHIILHRDHAKPTTRRDFLSTGLLSMAGSIVAPSIINVLASPQFAFGADAASCASSGATLPGFLTINVRGGMSISGNLPPLGEDRQPLAKYDLIGLGPDNNVFTDDTIGSNLLGRRVAGTQNAGVPVGHLFLGLVGAATAGTLAKTTMINMCTPSTDDTSDNEFDPTAMILALGAPPTSIMPKLAPSNTVTGIGQQSAVRQPQSAPLRVTSFADVQRALAPAGSLATRLDKPRREQLLRLVASLSGTQARAVAAPGSATGTTLARLVECATGQNITNSAVTDPGIDPAVGDGNIGALWGLNPATKTGDAYNKATIVYNTIKGNCDAGAIEEGGGDYHGQGRGVQNPKDQAVGRLIGLSLESAAQMNKPLVIFVVSDGSVSTGSGSALGTGFANDSGNKCTPLMFFFDPNMKPRHKEDAWGLQLGHMTAGQGCSGDTVVGSPVKAATAVAWNFAAFAGVQDRAEKSLSGIFQRSEIDEVVRILPRSQG